MIHVLTTATHTFTARTVNHSTASVTMKYSLTVKCSDGEGWSCSLLTKSNGHTNLLGKRGRKGWSSLEAAVVELTAERAAKAGPANLSLPVLPQYAGWAL